MTARELYSVPLCPFAHRIRLVIAEKGLAARLINVDPLNKPEDFRSTSPQGKVPVMRHGGRSVWESSVINEYLEEVFPGVPKMPGDLHDRVLVRMWVRFADTHLYDTTSRLLHNLGRAEPLLEQIQANSQVAVPARSEL